MSYGCDYTITKEQVINHLNQIKDPSGRGVFDARIVSDVVIDAELNIRITISSKTVTSLSEEHPDFVAMLFSRLQDFISDLTSEGAHSVEIYTP